ncbi:sensor histidine kinase [Melittangium boletus]|uniref:histidine kinase n=1 Tax=Melittangium boletus DSM 14713 TaxID=1294270 RepID=A0A286NVI1_9BACT|nr:ATP-binding protein [Melittangium boletus]ATB27168.1 hybrid sensor histidine kinase/response regulator [Melittangium boletus DSM 14713]
MSERPSASIHRLMELSAQRPLSLLLLEDNALDAELILARFEEEGLSLKVERVDGEAGFTRALERSCFDIILSDYNVPGFDGLSALSTARELCPDTPFLFVSGALGEERAIEMLKRGATDYVLKEHLERLVPCVARALREAEGEARRKRTEEALRASEERYALASRATFDAIWDWDLRTDTTHWNDTLEQVVGYTPAEMGQSPSGWSERIHPEDRERVLLRFRDAIGSREERWLEEYRFLHKNGTWCDVVDRGHIVREASGRPVRMVGAMQDISERKRAEVERQRLLQEARHRAEFEQQLMGIVSHDLRNPLSAILMAGALLLRREDASPWLTKTAARIVSSAERAHRMIRDLLDFTQARMGTGIPIQPSPLDIHELAHQVVEEARTAHPARELLLSWQGDGKGVWDSDRIAQVLSNILGNALRYGREGSPVRVETEGRAESVLLRVHNEGSPISPELLPRLFEPLTRGGTRLTQSDRSIGLGLYIVRQLVLAHRGSVDVRSTEAEGTTFTVRLPRVTPSSGTQVAVLSPPGG